MSWTIRLVVMTVLLAIGFAAGQLGAQNASVPMAVTKGDFINALRPFSSDGNDYPGSGAVSGFRTRGLSVSVTPSSAFETPRRVDFQVLFEFASADLNPAATKILDELGRALQSSDLEPYRFRIIGHTDITGSEEVNRSLSLRRAQAVATYLQRNFGINRQRLETGGRGSTELRDATNPTSGINRRVEIANLGR
jgi:outer membrane protein OmpA-like peptidoglycan-associated protein